MNIGVLREAAPGERRVSVTPAAVASLLKLKCSVSVEEGCGAEAGFPDEAYRAAGASLADREAIFAKSAILCGVRFGAASPGGRPGGQEEWRRLRGGQILLALCDCLGEEAAEANRALASSGATVFALELVPRITRAQSMDVLSSQATISGYKAALLAATSLPRLVPMFTTAAGTIKAAKALVLGAGVAGLQAIATLRRLGAIVSAYDVRAAVKEQIESLGGRFVDLAAFGGPVASGAEDRGGYAKALDESFYQQQREALAKVCAQQEIVVSTAAVPGRRSPLLITRAAVEAMAPGAVIVDLAAERGGNCELAKPDSEVVHHGVRILGPTNLPSTVPTDASQMFARNVLAFLTPILAAPRKGDGRGPLATDLVSDLAWDLALDLALDLEDEVIRETRLCAEGAIVSGRAAGRPAGAA
jgi:NAD(P) transhydrogenase subunit alpha